jgi:hypothetical protein
MDLRVAVYNVEWMKDLFRDGVPKLPTDGGDDGEDGERSAAIAEVVQAMDPDILLVVEGPDTLADQSKTASGQLEAWRDAFGLDPAYRGVHGIPSGGTQELCALYRSDRVLLEHDPEMRARRDPFDRPFLVDTLDSLIKEQYKHYRPPLELSVRDPAAPDVEVARIILAHAKSKGIFDLVDLARFEQLSGRNRKKLIAECYSIRQRCNQYLDEEPDRHVIVAGDINDGFGMDYYEARFARSAVEVLLGDVWEPEKILRHVLPRPKLNKYGWNPSSSRFRDRITGDNFNVLIDHLLVSRGVSVGEALVWNPYLRDAPDEVKALRRRLLDASDHFPVSAVLTL